MANFDTFFHAGWTGSRAVHAPVWRYFFISPKVYLPIQICTRYSIFQREYDHKFPKPGGNLKIPEGIFFKFTRVFSNSWRTKGIYVGIFTIKTEYFAYFFNFLTFLQSIKPSYLSLQVLVFIYKIKVSAFTKIEDKLN